MNIKQDIANHIKNIHGWKTKRKIVVISVDDYGNVRLDSKKAREKMDKAGLKMNSRFDALDTLETREDLEALYEVLASVKDKNGNFATFTPYSLSCNIDFEAMADNNYSEYVSEILPITFEKIALKDSKAYSGAWKLWQEGIEKGLMKPQFHGREHFNLHIFNDLLIKQDQDFLKVIKQNSHVSVPSHKNYKNGWTAAYSFDQIKETEPFLNNVTEGLKAFKEVYGYDSKVFTPPAQQFPLHLELELRDLGVLYIDRPRSLKRHLGNGQFQMEKHKLGGGTDMTELVRNVVFEPTHNRGFNWVDFTFKQVEAAFRMNKPAHISSHRVNYCGHINEENRKVGLTALKQLLDKIVKRWPDVEFVSADQLGDMIANNKK
jgi:hypothetical protein